MDRREVSRDDSGPWVNPAEVAEQDRRSLTRIIRLAFLVIFVTVTMLTVLDTEAVGPRLAGPGGLALKLGWQQVLIVASTLALVVVVIDALTTKKRISTLAAIFTGLVIALLSNYALGKVIDLLVDIYTINTPGLVATAKILCGIALSYLAIVTVLQTKDEFRLVIPYVEFAKSMRGARPLVLDSSALIDGRIAELAATGVLQAPMVVPRFVVGELQLLADHSDAQVRAKGRRGLDVITKLQRTAGVDVSVDETPTPAGASVDRALVELARSMRGLLVTTDTGLGRVASIQGVRVLNVHELALAVRPVVAAGDRLSLKVVKPGEQPAQGVGYLEDGTMVVLEDGRAWVGQTVGLTVVSTVQTAGGRLVFGRVGEDSNAKELNAKGPESAQGPESSKGPESLRGELSSSVVSAEETRVDPAAESGAGDARGEEPGGDDKSGRGAEERKPGPFPPKPSDRRFRSMRNPRR